MRWSDDPRRAATYAAAAFALSGVMGVVGAVANADAIERFGGSTVAIYWACAASLLVALVVPHLPWGRFGMRSTMVLPILGTALLVVSELGSRSARTVDGVMSTSAIVTLVFAWIGLTQRRGWCVWFSPVMAVGLVLAFHAGGAHVSVATSITSVLLAACVGELIAWVKQADAVRGEELGVVVDGTAQLRNEADPAAAADRLADTVAGLLGVPAVAIYLVDGGELRLTTGRGDHPWPEIRTAPPPHRVVSRVTPQGTELVIPLVGRSGQVHGLAVGLGRRRQDEFMLRLAQMLGEQAGHRLGELAELDALTDESRRDPLTGVANRRQAEEWLARMDVDDVVAVIDLDDLRGINARSGHPGGDEAIRAVATYLLDTLRVTDDVARLGGDEFVVFLRGAGEAAFPLLERIAEDWNLANPDTTFSVGASAHRSQDAEATLRAADAALFDAKRNGRARTEVASPRPVVDAVAS
jgi:diguanylate cyclase (GGDEF)-like protein